MQVRLAQVGGNCQGLTHRITRLARGPVLSHDQRREDAQGGNKHVLVLALRCHAGQYLEPKVIDGGGRRSGIIQVVIRINHRRRRWILLLIVIKYRIWELISWATAAISSMYTQTRIFICPMALL